jgi:hypothetical protein
LLAGWYGSELFPDTFLKGRAPHVQRKTNADAGIFREADDARAESFKAITAADRFLVGKFATKVTLELLSIITQQ